MGRHRSDEDTTFRLLFVCTGNICRSPYAEITMRDTLIGRFGGRAAAQLQVSSAGVHAVVGAPMHPDSRAELVPWGLDNAAAELFRARQLRSAMVLESDLVLGATPRHRSSVVQHVPAALPITFSLKEFARLAAAVDPTQLPSDLVERALALVELARAQRGLVPPPEDGDEVPDPMGKPSSAHRTSATLIREAIQRIVNVLVPESSQRALRDVPAAGQ